MEVKKELAELALEMKLPQKDHTPFVGKEFPSILFKSKDNLHELSTAQILVQSPLALIQIFMGPPKWCIPQKSIGQLHHAHQIMEVG